MKVLVNSQSTRENMRRKIKENYCPTGSREDRSVARAALNYPLAIINSFIIKTIRSFLYGTRKKNKEDSSVVRASLFFKDQTSTNSVKRQMCDLSHKIGTTLQPVFISTKLNKTSSPEKSSLQT